MQGHNGFGLLRWLTSRQKSFGAATASDDVRRRPRRRSFITVLAVSLTVAGGLFSLGALPASALPQTTIDEDGANDEPNEKVPQPAHRGFGERADEHQRLLELGRSRHDRWRADDRCVRPLRHERRCPGELCDLRRDEWHTRGTTRDQPTALQLRRRQGRSLYEPCAGLDDIEHLQRCPDQHRSFPGTAAQPAGRFLSARHNGDLHDPTSRRWRRRPISSTRALIPRSSRTPIPPTAW